MKRETFTPDLRTLDGCYRCEGCDKPRAGVLAFCEDCEEVTDSYLDKQDAHMDYVQSRFNDMLDVWADGFSGARNFGGRRGG